MVEQIGLQAVLDDANFQQGIQRYVKGIQRAQAETNRVASEMGTFSARVDAFADALSKTSPRSLELARNYEKLINEFQQGNVNLNEARARINEIQTELADLNRTSQDSQSQVKSNQLVWTEFNSALQAGTTILREVFQAAKVAYEFISEGADLDLAAQKFENVAEAAGFAADTLLTDMRRATRGLVSDAELTETGLNIIELRLADTEEGVVDLANVISALGLDMQQVILTFANNSKARLDSLGLSVEGVTQRVAELNAEGFDGDAFDQAVLDGLIARAETLGDAAETAAGQLDIFENNLKNANDEAKRASVEGVLPLIKATNEYAAVSNALNDAINNRVITEQEAVAIELEYHNGAKTSSEIVTELTERTNTYNESLKRVNDITWMYTESQDILAESTENVTIEYGAASNMLQFYAQRAMEAEQRTFNFGTALRMAAEDAQITSESIGGVAVEMAQLAAVGQELNASLDDMLRFDEVFAGDDADRLIASTTDHIIKQMEALAQLGMQGGRTAEAYDEMFRALEALDPELAQNMRDSQMFTQLLDGLDTALKSNVISAEDYADIIADVTAAIEGGAEPAQALETALGKLQTAKDSLTEEGVSALEGFLPPDEIADIQADLEGLIDTADDAVLEADDQASAVIDPLLAKARQWAQEHMAVFTADGDGGGGGGGLNGGTTDDDGDLGDIGGFFFGGGRRVVNRFGAFAKAIGADIEAAYKKGLAELEEGEDLGELMLETFIKTGRELSNIGGAFVSMFEEAEIDPLRANLQAMQDELADVNQQIGETRLQTELWKLAERRFELEKGIAEQSERVAEAEAKVLRFQEQQQQLAFLEQQIKLLDFIKERGLDPSEILGGLQFGLEASLPDLIDAMSAAMQAVIEAANKELGIASPSKVFADMFTNVMDTSEETIAKLATLPATAMNDAMNLVTATAAQTTNAPLASSVVSRTANFNFGNVNISNGMELAAFDNRMRRIAREEFTGAVA